MHILAFIFIIYLYTVGKSGGTLLAPTTGWPDSLPPEHPYSGTRTAKSPQRQPDRRRNKH
jgi:hypothetical protein